MTVAAPRNFPTPRGTVTVHPNDQRFTRIKPGILRMHMYTCWICGHPGNAGNLAIDHVVPLAECRAAGIDPFDTRNMRPAHHHGGGCPTCSAAAGRAIRCNQIRGALSVERARQVIADRTGLTIAGFAPSGSRPHRAPSAPSAPAGEREW